MMATAEASARSQLLTVKVADAWFGLPIARVRTIFRIGAIARVPLAPAAVLGLVNLRGAIVPALSLRRRLHLPESATALGALAVSLDHEAESFALVVDDVGDVVAIEASDALALPPHMAASLSALTRAVYRLADKLLPVLDVSLLVSGAPLQETPP